MITHEDIEALLKKHPRFQEMMVGLVEYQSDIVADTVNAKGFTGQMEFLLSRELTPVQILDYLLGEQ